jgi:hypothetical protein
LTTAEILESVTDTGKFELLVTSILWNRNPDYAAIVPNGVNSKGKSVKSPLDGFCLVPGSDPPRFLLVQHTTTDRTHLREKWLRQSAALPAPRAPGAEGEGDLEKAGRLAKRIRSKFPNGSFSVVLSTNQRIDTEFQLEVYGKAEEFGLSCDIWELLRIAGYLDNTAEGHWLRRQYLGIGAEMLSRPLLQHLCNESLQQYERFLDALGEPLAWIARDTEKQLQGNGADGEVTIQLLVGLSGSGKSVLAYKALREQLRSDALGLWIPANLIDECISIEDAMMALCAGCIRP